MNDWEIKKFLVSVIIIQLALLVLVALAALGFDIPVLRQTVGFIFLTFIPGFIILRLLKLHRLGAVLTLLLSVGLSLTFVMWISFFMNSLFPLIGMKEPISIWPLICTLSVLVLCLSAVLYKVDKGFSVPIRYDWHRVTSPPVLFLVLIPLLSILGTQLINQYHSNVLLLLLILVIALIPIVIAFTKFIPRDLYPLAVISISIALLFHSSLITNYITGYDIHTEYYFANLVKIHSLWDSTIDNPYNAMLSLVMLAPTYSIICGLDLTWVFKIIYPLLFTLVPLGIYQLSKQYFDRTIALLSSFLFMSIMTFYNDMIALARQEVAEVFFILIFVVMFNKSINRVERTILGLIFGASLIVSHYSLSYIFVVLLVVAPIVILILERISSLLLQKRDHGFNKYNHTDFPTVEPSSKLINRKLTLGFIAFFIFACLSWYIWQSNSSAFTAFVMIGRHITDTLVTEFASLMSSEALWLIMTPARSPIHEIAKYLNLVIILLIAVGIINLIKHWRDKNTDEEFSSFALVSFVLLIIALPVPYLAIALNTTRLYHINLILLAPFGITGAIITFQFLFSKVGRSGALGFVSILLSVQLLLGSGFVHEIARDPTFTGSLVQESISVSGNIKEKAFYYGAYTAEEDVFSAKWLSANISGQNNTKIYSTYWSTNQVHALESYGMVYNMGVIPLISSTQAVAHGSYIYLQYFNITEGIGTEVSPKFRRLETFNMSQLGSLLNEANIIYSNTGSRVLLTP